MTNEKSNSKLVKANPYLTNPLHGTSLDTVLEEIVAHYSWEILAAYINIQCFKKHPSMPSSLKFLKKTDWAREKVESFYLYQFKGLPKASEEQFLLPPRERIIPEKDKPGSPQELSLEDAERLREKRAKKAREHNAKGSKSFKGNNPWANY